MLRYQIVTNPKGHHLVLPASAEIVPLDETYATRLAAQETADWLNSLGRRQREWAGEKAAAQVRRC